RYQGNEQEVFLGHSVTQSTNMSEETAKLIDGEVRKLIEYGETRARRTLTGEAEARPHDILTPRREDVERLAQALLEYETLTGDEITDILKGKMPNREPTDEPPAPRGSALTTPTKRARAR